MSVLVSGYSHLLLFLLERSEELRRNHERERETDLRQEIAVGKLTQQERLSWKQEEHPLKIATILYMDAKHGEV